MLDTTQIETASRILRDHWRAGTKLAGLEPQLRPRDRAMLWMAYAEGASHEDIAGVIGVRPSSMKLLLFRARRKMAQLMTAGGAR